MEHHPLTAELCDDAQAERAGPPSLLARGRTRAFAILAALLCLGAAATWLTRGASAPCAAGGTSSSAESLVSLAASYPPDLADLFAKGGDRDALGEWLEAASAAGQAAEGARSSPEVAAEAQRAMQKAMQVKDPREAKRLVHRAMSRAVSKSQVRRRDVQALLGGRSSKAKLFRKAGRPTKTETAAQATCAFRVLHAVNVVAEVAADLNDATKTCKGVELQTAWTKNNTHGKICVMNVGAVVVGFTTLAATLSAVADNCAATLIPNVDALCAAAVTGLVTSTAQLAGAGVLIAGACKKPGEPSYIFGPDRPGLTPSNVGANSDLPYSLDYTPGSSTEHSGGTSPNREGAAQRRLFGGGKGSMATRCFVDVSNMAWYLAQAGLSLSSATGHTGFGSCKAVEGSGKGFVGGLMKGYCAADITGVISYFGGVVAYLQLALVHCSDTLNFPAICGTGIDGIIAALSGMAQTSIGADVACGKLQHPLVKTGIAAGSALDRLTHGAISGILGARRLGAESGGEGKGGGDGEGRGPARSHDVSELKGRFASPADAWRSIGVDLDDRDADFRKQGGDRASPAEFLSLVEEQEPERSLGGGLFGTSQTCL